MTPVETRPHLCNVLSEIEVSQGLSIVGDGQLNQLNQRVDGNAVHLAKERGMDFQLFFSNIGMLFFSNIGMHQGVKMFTKPHGLQNIIAEEWSAICIFSLCFNAYGKTEKLTFWN